MAAILSALLILVGTFFMLVAALGVVRFPDLYMRLHSSTKSATLGVGCVMLGAAIHFNDVGFATQALAITLFLLVTAPVAAHLLGRAAYLSGVPLWEHTLSDELRGRYDQVTHDLASTDTK
ncbi:MAG: monovalent cation/H(+) antiporter subunit G [Chloroflexi bacterium]|nr:monovalent cation/H(+) antiporter subunit G [Chloroflexota bacterium]